MTGEAFVLGLLALLTILVSVVLWNVFATARARLTATRDATARGVAARSDPDYRRLAERAVDAQERTAQSLAELTRHLDLAADGDPETPPGRS